MGGWAIRNEFYMLIGGMYTIMRKKRLLRVGIMWKFSVLTGRRFFGKW